MSRDGKLWTRYPGDHLIVSRWTFKLFFVIFSAPSMAISMEIGKALSVQMLLPSSGRGTRRWPMYFPIRWSLPPRPKPDNTFWTDSTPLRPWSRYQDLIRYLSGISLSQIRNRKILKVLIIAWSVPEKFVSHGLCSVFLARFFLQLQTKMLWGSVLTRSSEMDHFRGQRLIIKSSKQHRDAQRHLI